MKGVRIVHGVLFYLNGTEGGKDQAKAEVKRRAACGQRSMYVKVLTSLYKIYDAVQPENTK